MTQFKFDPASTAPPIFDTVSKILSPPAGMSLEAAATIIAGMIYNDSAVQAVYEIHQSGDGFRGDAKGVVKAAAYDIMMKYSGDMTQSSHTAAMFHTAVHRAVELIIGKMRIAGVIL